MNITYIQTFPYIENGIVKSISLYKHPYVSCQSNKYYKPVVIRICHTEVRLRK